MKKPGCLHLKNRSAAGWVPKDPTNRAISPSLSSGRAAGKESVNVTRVFAKELMGGEDVVNDDRLLLWSCLTFHLHLDLSDDHHPDALGTALVTDTAEEPVVVAVTDDIDVLPVIGFTAVGAADTAKDLVEPAQITRLVLLSSELSYARLFDRSDYNMSDLDPSDLYFW